MDVTVREADLADPNDAQAIRDLTNAYSQDPMGTSRPLPDDVLDRLPEALRTHGGMRVLLAFKKDEPVGLLTAIKSFSTFQASPILNVHDIYVKAGLRGQAIGARLLAEAERIAKELGYPKCSLEVLTNNPAKRLYTRTGYSFQSEYWIKNV